MEELLGLLDRLTVILGELTAVQKDVAASVHEDDLIRLGGLEKITLSALPEQIDSMELREKVKDAAERLSAQYRIMQSAAEVARSALECSLHQVENMIAGLGLDPEHVKDHTITTGGPHTDFRA